MRLPEIIAIVAFLGVGAIRAQDSRSPPTWPEFDIKPSGTKLQPVTGVTLGSFHVTFGRTTFTEVADALGASPTGRQGDAGEFQMWVCYTVPAVRARIWLTSSELGGEKYIDGLVVQPVQPKEAKDPMCPVPVREAAVAFIDNRIWIGASVAKVESILGAPNRVSKSVIYYLYEGKDGEFDVSNVLALKIQNDRVTAIFANHSATS